MMNWTTLADVKTTLDAALRDKLCVQAWLGIGQALFIGFGDDVLPPTLPGEQHSMPLYELETCFTDWWIQDQHNVLVTSNDNKECAESSATRLVGKRIVDWCFMDASAALQIIFEDGLELRMAPYGDCNSSLEDAWILRGPVYYGFMKWDGTMGNGRRDHYFVDKD